MTNASVALPSCTVISCVSPVRQQRRSVCIKCCLQQNSVLEELKSLGVRPKKSLGQNFLVSEAVLSDIVNAASVQAGDHILEIGPGLGTLTDRLVKLGATVLAIEKDDLFAKHLEKKFLEVEQVAVVHADVLAVRQLPEMIRTFQPAHGAKVKVVANIPYNITSDLLSVLLPMRQVIESLYLLLEKGAAVRLTQARPGDKDYRAMSVILGLYCQARLCFGVSREAFHPVPGVDSAVAEFNLHEQLDKRVEEHEDDFVAFVSAAFSMKRKTLINNLKSWNAASLPNVVSCLDSGGLSPQIRAEALDVSAFIALYTCLRVHHISRK
ncbi:g3400 [Coccomyxa viridis]|uniref:rRNA adenine N(6)-methyltransferase n=1 Tax=Coccomyxa viridis TaxID=1274662 RepID=A0ABP1FMP8_9CHLO